MIKTPSKPRGGHFVKGGIFGPGRPKATRSRSDYLVRLTDQLPFSTWEAICEKAVEQALEGDARAREWLGNYAIGRPLQALEISGPDRAPVPWQVMQLIITAVREAVPDPVAQHRIAEALERLTHPAPQLPAPGGTAPSTPRALG